MRVGLGLAAGDGAGAGQVEHLFRLRVVDERKRERGDGVVDVMGHADKALTTGLVYGVVHGSTERVDLADLREAAVGLDAVGGERAGREALVDALDGAWFAAQCQPARLLATGFLGRRNSQVVLGGIFDAG